MDDAAKLSLPAFERQHAGMELTPDGTGMASLRVVRRTARYEQIVIDSTRPTGQRTTRRQRFTRFPTALFAHFLRDNAVARAAVARRQAELRLPFVDTVAATAGSYAVAFTRDNRAAAPMFASAASARDHLRDRVAAEPRLATALHVIPGPEVRPE
jgi:hypothetical protein